MILRYIVYVLGENIYGYTNGYINIIGNLTKILFKSKVCIMVFHRNRFKFNWIDLFYSNGSFYNYCVFLCYLYTTYFYTV